MPAEKSSTSSFEGHLSATSTEQVRRPEIVEIEARRDLCQKCLRSDATVPPPTHQFQTLMKKAAALTSASSKEAADLLAQREAALRKARQQQDERDAKERAQRKTQLLREVEARKKAEADEARKEEEARKRQEEKARGALDSDPLVARAVQHLQSSNRKSRSSSPRAGLTSAATALTREEKRALADPLFRETITTRPRGVSAHPKSNRRLPGGGVLRKATQALSASSSGTPMSAKERIAASFQTLTPLNTVKKDMRTIDEITRDLERGRFNHSPEKVELTGYEATAFTDWFGKSKKEREREAALARKSQEGSASGIGRSEPPSSSSSSSLSKPSPRHPASIQSTLTKSAPPTASVNPNNNNRLAKTPAGTSSGRPVAKQGIATSSSNARPRSSSHLANARFPPSSSSRPVTSSQPSTASSSAHRKRSQASRSQDSDDSDPSSTRSSPRPEKRRRGALSRDDEDDDDGGYVPGSIAALFGRNLHKDAARDVLSDDEDDDMEARGYDAIAREEATSAKIAKREDALAEAEERRREVDKRKRRIEREKRTNTGSAR